jgi:TonB-dependent SusC/RagA subfamily outer membrane receptor
MKKILVILLLLKGGINVLAQESFQKELFSVDAVLKYRNEIGLSPQQVENIKKIYDNHIRMFNSNKWDLDAELVVLNKYLSQSVVDEESSMAQMEKIMTLEDQLKRMKLGMLIKIKNELKESQQEELKNLRTEKDIEGMSEITPISENPRIVIRGTSIGAAANPLYIIIDKKGERRVSSISDIRSSQIESINVIKDEAATQLYGTEGKNGVIIIKMKN